MSFLFCFSVPLLFAATPLCSADKAAYELCITWYYQAKLSFGSAGAYPINFTSAVVHAKFLVLISMVSACTRPISVVAHQRFLELHIQKWKTEHVVTPSARWMHFIILCNIWKMNKKDVMCRQCFHLWGYFDFHKKWIRQVLKWNDS